MSSIKTPDQRVRVFISSTIQELADERKAVTDAVSKLRLIPVLFELGARPHPPRDLYRAYLDQSHVFIGIYWNNYGWIAPGMQISGLEDEYRLSGGKPQLIYVKQDGANRQPRLQELLAEIEKSGIACYRFFDNAQELSELVENDLALLLSERFETKTTAHSPQENKKQNTLPIIRSSLVGRERELLRLKEMILQPAICLVTLTGTGGTGKTRLSIQLANEVKAEFRDGVYYIPLASITDEKLVAATIANEIGLYDTGHQPIEETLLDYLRDKNCLLVIDNFEQIVGAASVVAKMMERCSAIKIIVTSRIPLHIRAEHVVPISTLANPDLKKIMAKNDLLKYPSVELFLQRAMEVNPGLAVSDENLVAIGEICAKLDGLPLAIELAAARSNFFTPVALLKRMGKALDFLSHGPKDLPQRQQTLRSTIDWSYNLMDDDCRKYFYRLAVFSEGWTLEAAQAVGNYKNDLQCDTVLLTEKLVDFGLFRIFSHYNEKDATVEPRFTMLQTVLEYAIDKLQESDEIVAVKNAHADYFILMLEETYPYLWGAKPEPWLDHIEREFQNIRSAFYAKTTAGNMPESIRLIGTMTMFWGTRGRINEGLEWAKTTGIDNPELREKLKEKTEPGILARGLMGAGALRLFISKYVEGAGLLNEAVSIFIEQKDFRHAGRALIYRGIAGISSGDYQSALRLREAIEYGRATNDAFSIGTACGFLGEVLTYEGKFDEAKLFFEEGEKFCTRCDFNAGLAVIFLQKGCHYLVVNDYENGEATLSKSVELFASTYQVPLKGWAEISLAFCQMLKDELANGLKSLNNGMNTAREIGDKSMMVFALNGFSMLFVKKGDCRTAARLRSVSDAVNEALNFVPWSSERQLNAWVDHEISKSISAEDLAKEREAGKKIQLEKAIEIARAIEDNVTTREITT